MMWLDRVFFARDGDPLDNIVQFPDVTGPRVIPKNGKG